MLITDTLAAPADSNVFQWLTDNFKVPGPGGVATSYDPTRTPYFAEILEAMNSRAYREVVMVGPSQSGKTLNLLTGHLVHSLATNRYDSSLMLLPNVERANDWSLRSFDRAVRDNKQLQDMIPPGRSQTLSRKLTANGQVISILSPTVNSVSGRSYRTVYISDVDRLKEHNLEGSFVALARARTRVYGSRGCLLLESSPSFDLPQEVSGWESDDASLAPPVEGILASYNLGTRRQLFAPCPHCGEFYNPGYGIDSIHYPDEGGPAERAEQAYIVCPHCGGCATDEHRQAMIANSRWQGPDVKSSVASFWMSGLLAGFSSFKDIATNLIKAQAELESTGSDSSLKVCLNNDLAGVHEKTYGGRKKDASIYMDRAVIVQEGEVPEGTKVVIATVDVQKNSFEVQITAVKSDWQMRVINRFSVTNSRRKGPDGDRLPLSPHTHQEDWHILTSLLFDRKILDSHGKQWSIGLTLCDSAGMSGVTKNAFNFARSLKGGRYTNRFQLVKGTAKGKDFSFSYPTSARRGEKASKGDVKLMLLNSNTMKDLLFSNLERYDVGPGYIELPEWLPESYFEELCSEYRAPDGTYHKQYAKIRNEAIDLLYYTYAGLFALGYHEKGVNYFPGTPTAGRSAASYQPRPPIKIDNGLGIEL